MVHDHYWILPIHSHHFTFKEKRKIMNIINVATSAIVTNPANPSSRTPDDELVESIKQNNILTPLLVRLDKETKKAAVEREAKKVKK